MTASKDRIFRLEGQIQHYDWGGSQFIPALLHRPNPDGQPFAEYWLGAHDQASASLVLPSGEKTPLNEYIRKDPKGCLGPAVATRFGQLPYLLKVLDVESMLSIQVHPSRVNAEREFQEEERLGVPIHSPGRLFKDRNHKPELMVALSEFWLVQGFKPRAAMAELFNRVPELKFLLAYWNQGGYEAVYRLVMEMDQEKVNSILQPLLDRILPEYENDLLPKESEDFWAARAALRFAADHPADKGNIDRGIFSLYFFNLQRLEPGQGIFQGDGTPHAYLEGRNIELMANSDNVLRGGLTSKRVDVAGLMRHLRFEAAAPRILTETGVGNHLSLFRSPAPDFELGLIRLDRDEEMRFISRSASILLVMEGELKVSAGEQPELPCSSGEALIAFDRAELRLRAGADVILYRAAVPESTLH